MFIVVTVEIFWQAKPPPPVVVNTGKEKIVIPDCSTRTCPLTDVNLEKLGKVPPAFPNTSWPLIVTIFDKSTVNTPFSKIERLDGKLTNDDKFKDPDKLELEVIDTPCVKLASIKTPNVRDAKFELLLIEIKGELCKLPNEIEVAPVEFIVTPVCELASTVVKLGKAKDKQSVRSLKLNPPKLDAAE